MFVVFGEYRLDLERISYYKLENCKSASNEYAYRLLLRIDGSSVSGYYKTKKEAMVVLQRLDDYFIEVSD